MKIFMFAKMVPLCLLIIMGCSMHSRDTLSTSSLLIKKVVTDPHAVLDGEYEAGNVRYPAYAYQGLPDTFLIKKSPDLIIAHNDIRKIQIQKAPSSTAEPTYIVLVSLDPNKLSEVKAFAVRNLNQRVTIEIENNILSIVKILDVPSDDILFSTNMDLAHLHSALKRVFPKVSLPK